MMESFNPWWREPRLIELDEDYHKWKQSKVKWTPRLLQEIDLKPFALHFIYGPRQVGKTTLLKLLVKLLLDRGVNSKAIFYLRCDQLADFKELGEFLDRYLEYRRLEGIESSYLLLDEITFPADWWRAIKLRIDLGIFRNDLLIFTGSLSMYAKGEVETLPGRRGSGKDYILHPLSFRDYLRIRDPGLHSKAKPFKQLSPEEVLEKTRQLLPWIDQLNTYFKEYLECGGYPLPIKDHLEKGKITEETINTYLSWIRGDLAKLRRSESIAKRIMRAILEKQGSIVTWHNLAKEFEVKSHRTVYTYMDFLEKLLLAKVLHFIDPNKGLDIFYKGKKVHLTDPFLYTAISHWCFAEKPKPHQLAEAVVATHLARQWPVGYWKNRREVDVVVNLRHQLIGIEVKYQDRVEGRKASIGKMKHIITLSKTSYHADPPVTPISAFLACLEV